MLCIVVGNVVFSCLYWFVGYGVCVLYVVLCWRFVCSVIVSVVVWLS